MTTTTNDPIVIGFEQIQNAAHALGVTDLAHLKELRVEPDKVTVVRYRVEDGRRVYIADGWLTDTSTIPVVYDDEAAEKLRPASADLLDSVLPGEEGY